MSLDGLLVAAVFLPSCTHWVRQGGLVRQLHLITAPTYKPLSASLTTFEAESLQPSDDYLKITSLTISPSTSLRLTASNHHPPAQYVHQLRHSETIRPSSHLASVVACFPGLLTSRHLDSLTADLFIPTFRMCHPVFLDRSVSVSSFPMDSYRADRQSGDSYSQPTRSRASSRVSATAAQLGNIHLADSPRSLPLDSSPCTSPELLPSPAYLSGHHPQGSTGYLPTPISGTYSPFPILSPEILNAEWAEEDLEVKSDHSPFLTVEHAQYQHGSEQSSLVSGAPSTMRQVSDASATTTPPIQLTRHEALLLLFNSTRPLLWEADRRLRGQVRYIDHPNPPR